MLRLLKVILRSKTLSKALFVLTTAQNHEDVLLYLQNRDTVQTPFSIATTTAITTSLIQAVITFSLVFSDRFLMGIPYHNFYLAIHLSQNSLYFKKSYSLR